MAQSRNEAILENILGADNEITYPPQSRIEALLIQIMEMLSEQDPGEPVTDAEIDVIIEELI